MKHRILVVGTGSIGERHVRCYLATARCDVGIVETNAALRETIASRYRITEAFDSLDAALPHSWHAAVVATPAHTHISLAQRLADHGVHLLIEKPLALGLEGIDRLQETVTSKALVAGVAYVYRAHPLAAKMHDLVHGGRFGKPLQMYITAGQNFAFYRPAYRDIYYAHRSAGGGAIQDALTHLLNFGEWLAGPIRSLAIDASHQALEGVTVEDTVHLIARQGEALTSYALNQYQAPNESVITVVCSRGTVRMHLQNGEVTSMTDPTGTWNIELTARLERDEWFTAQCNAFLDALESRRPVLCTIEEGAQTMRAVIKALACVDAGTSLVPV